MKLLSQPILHFLLLGGLFFATYSALNPESDTVNTKKIVLDEVRLLEYSQYRRRSFEGDEAIEAFNQLTASDLEALKEQYLRDEVLYREAKSLQLENGDFVIRQRLIQKMEYLLKGFSSQENSLSEQAVAEYYLAHRDDYDEAPRLTFTHVFLRSDRGEDEAKELLSELQQNQISAAEALAYGDRFLYHRNYVDQTPDAILSHFGEEFVRKLMEENPSDHRWFGPFQSPYGFHLVRYARYTPGGIPELATIYQVVARDAAKAIENEKTEKAIARLIRTYDIHDEVEYARKAAAAND